jgi:RNA polymerase sigma factor (sigma-70 family)
VDATATAGSEPRVPVVHIVDDDDDVCQSLRFLLASVGIDALIHPGAATFLAELDTDRPAVVILDVRMPGMSGFQLQDELLRLDYPAPLIFCSAHGDIPMSVRALSRAAVDFLEKPYEPQRMLDVVQQHLPSATSRFAEAAQRRALVTTLSRLTRREREVLALVVSGLSSKQIARRIGASVKTVDVHRTRVKAKTGAESLGTLVRDIWNHQVSLEPLDQPAATRR